MADWNCKDCGYSKESRCKPKKCPECEGREFVKAADAGETGKKKMSCKS